MRLEIECFMLRYPINTKNIEMGLLFMPNLSSFGSLRSGGTSNNFERWASTVLVNGIKRTVTRCTSQSSFGSQSSG